MPAFAGMTILAPLNERRWLARSLSEEEEVNHSTNPTIVICKAR